MHTLSHTFVPSKSSKQVLCEALTAQLSASLGVNVKCLEQVEVKSERQKILRVYTLSVREGVR